MELTWGPLPVACVGRGAALIRRNEHADPVAAVFDPYLARPVAAILAALGNGRGRLDDARASLAHHLAARLGVDEAEVADALDWAVRRAHVEVIPDEVAVIISNRPERRAGQAARYAGLSTTTRR